MVARVLGHRAMTPQRRFDIARRLTREGRWIAFSMARKRHPRTGREIEFELWNRIHGVFTSLPTASPPVLWTRSR